MLKVVHLQTHLPSSGNAAFRLHEALCQAGVHSSMLSLTSDIAQEGIAHLGRKPQVISFLNNKLQAWLTQNMDWQFGMYSFPILGSNVARHAQVRAADIVYLHWVLGGFLSLRNMEQLARLGKPVIVFMHDMWAITGGCHHSFACEKYTLKCSGCQMFPARERYELPALEFAKKQRLYQKYDNLFFVAPSKWLYELAKRSALTRDKPVYHIPNVINTGLFKPVAKKVARQVLNLDADDTIIAFGAASPRSPYKGWEYLRQALTLLYQAHGGDKLSVVIFGSSHDEQIARAIPFKTTFLGRLRDDYSTVLAYNAADVFVAPSLADNLPTTVMESMCCGTPVAGFEVGGIPDMISHKENGYLAKYKDAQDLADGIQYCIGEQLKGSLLPAFAADAILARHFALYDEVLTLKPQA